MDQEIFARSLHSAQRNVRLGAEHIRKQRCLIETLEKDGHDTGIARELLHTFEQVEKTHIEHRDRVQHQIERDERPMADDKTRTGKADRDRINVGEAYELRDWCKKFSVSEGELKAAVKAVGPMAKDVAKKLGKSL
jgi:hypothetical protein